MSHIESPSSLVLISNCSIYIFLWKCIHSEIQGPITRPDLEWHVLRFIEYFPAVGLPFGVPNKREKKREKKDLSGLDSFVLDLPMQLHEKFQSVSDGR